ncbi:MAG: hypothetical protein ABR97_07625 [Rhodobacter sp. BACL10 MAG-120419-bin15]|nr:MAG: hypothetical protein ABR97_07625 [Rhodobacter sp. BACL10 MAG-120419-bin15]
MNNSPPASLPNATSLTLRLAVALILLLTAGGAAMAVAAIAYGKNAAQQSYDRLLIGAANQIAKAITLQEGQLRIDLPVAAFELLALAPQDRIVYAIYDTQGALLTGYPNVDGPKQGQYLSDGFFTGEAARFAAADRRFSERALSGTVRVVVGQTLRARLELTKQITQSALIVVGLAGLLMSGLAVFAVRSALGPLQRIEHDLAARTPADLTPLSIAVPREISQVVGTLNGFMARVDRQVAATRRLIGDASHQLRTPIAAIRAQSELAIGESDPVRLRSIMTRIHRRTVSLSRLTDQLLNHALIIHRADAVPLDQLDLRRVAIIALEEIDSDPRLSGQDIMRLDLPEDPVMVQGDLLSLGEACKNLATNAQRHGAAPFMIKVSQQGRMAILAVQDSGGGIPKNHWQDAGTRFSRKPASRPPKLGWGFRLSKR